MSARTPSVVLVGRGAPERGGIPTYLETVRSSELARRAGVRLLNLARPDVRQGGRATASNVTRTLGDAARLGRTARRGDVVHLNTALAPGVTLVRTGALVLAARARGAQVLVHVHGGMVALWMTTPRRRALVRACLAGAQRIATVAEGGRAAMVEACGPDRVLLLDNAVDAEAFRGPAQGGDPPRVLFAGGLTPRKGVLDLVGASSLLRERGCAHELWLAGGTPDEGSAAERTVREGAGDQVRFLGAVEPAGMPELLRSVDVFCLPSWYEAMPLSVLEAMATGLPVVATDVGDVARAVLDGRTGRVVPARDPAALADALEQLLRDPATRRRYGAAGRAEVEQRFSLPVLEDRLGEVYRDLGASLA
ncbi:MAG TPA: glycosyltransferase family 4 protein [Mycobacteriales bacterium]|nr:glycosyltransferase family 4 protein [Mycobacteriales bacterium]